MLKEDRGTLPELCLNQYFPLNNYDLYNYVVKDGPKLSVKSLKIEINLVDWTEPAGKKWVDYLIENLSKKYQLLLSFNLKSDSSLNTAALIDKVLNTYNKHFHYAEITSRSRKIPKEILRKVIRSIRSKEKKLVIQKDLLTDIRLQPGDIISISVSSSDNLAQKIARIKNELKAPVWITSFNSVTGEFYSFNQIVSLSEAALSGAERIYWNNLFDTEELSGLKDIKGVPKLAFRLLEKDGLKGIISMSGIKEHFILKDINQDMNDFTTAAKRNVLLNSRNLSLMKNGNAPVIIFGGAGFIGTNVADQYLANGAKVRIYDNLSRPGVEENLKWLVAKHGSDVEVIIDDVRDAQKVAQAVKGVSRAFNFAAQVAVTTSLEDPVNDFEVNIRGTLNILEALRKLNYPVPLVFTSTNKVYGGLEDIKIELNNSRYEPLNDIIKANGINEARPLDFHSPYGCSKGSADQYVLDYSRSYKMPGVVFRMSCIYGPHQFGTEDQGWVAHFLIQTIKHNKIILYGDGKQVRDVLYVEDLVKAFILAQNNIGKLSGNAFNIGGGVKNTVSLLEILKYISGLTGIENKISHGDWRTSDQKYYVSDINKFHKAAGWEPLVDYRTGVSNLYNWLLSNYPFAEKERTEKTEKKIQEKKVLAS